jgi:hypothetical protein
MNETIPDVGFSIIGNIHANTPKKDETFKMVRILRGNFIYDHLL